MELFRAWPLAEPTFFLAIMQTSRIASWLWTVGQGAAMRGATRPKAAVRVTDACILPDVVKGRGFLPALTARRCNEHLTFQLACL